MFVASERTHAVTTTLTIAPAHTWLARQAADSLWGHTHTPPAPLDTHSAVLTVSALPRALRAHVERAMAVCLRSEPAEAPTGTDPLAAEWFTRWERDRGVEKHYAVRCRQVITGTQAELRALERVLGGLAAEHGFDVGLRLV